MTVRDALATPDKEYYLGSDGSLENYPQIYKVNPADLEAAEKLESFILNEQEHVETSYLKIGAALVEFEERKLWTAKGLPSFRAWLSGPEFHFGYEQGTRLMRIVRDLLPNLPDGTPRPPLSTLKEMLPLLADGTDSETLAEIAAEVANMTTRDAKRHIHERRGIGGGAEPVIFRARVQLGSEYNLTRIFRTGGDGDDYELTEEGPLRIKPKDWQRWSERFNEGFIEYVEAI